MPSTSFAGRRPRYIEQYARTVAAYQRFDDITRDIASEQDRINYLDSLLQNENANLTNLNEVFRVRPPDASGAMELLRQQYASEDASRRRTAAASCRRRAWTQRSLLRSSSRLTAWHAAQQQAEQRAP